MNQNDLEELRRLNDVRRPGVVDKHKFIPGKGEWTGGKKCKVYVPEIEPGFTESIRARQVLEEYVVQSRRSSESIEVAFGECRNSLASVVGIPDEARDSI